MMRSYPLGTCRLIGIPIRLRLHTHPHAQRNEYGYENREQPRLEGIVQDVYYIGYVPDNPDPDTYKGLCADKTLILVGLILTTDPS